MTINEAILKVISTQYKKDAKEAHQVVEAAGYTIEKRDGCYYVRNEKTYRYCYMINSGYYRQGARWVLYWGSMGRGSKTYYGNPEHIKFDFIHMLNKRYNYAGHGDRNACTSAAKEKWTNICRLKCMVSSKQTETELILKEMEKLQKRLIETTECKVKYETDLNNQRKEYGLKEVKR